MKEFIKNVAELHPAAQVSVVIMVGLAVIVLIYSFTAPFRDN